MGSIQSFLAIGAIILFALISMRFNSSVLQNSTVEIENKVYLTAFSLADDLIEEIKQKAFDESTAKALRVVDLTSLSETLGPESGEVWPHFNDIDDYNGYSKPVSLPHAENYTVHCTIRYFDPNNPELENPGRTFYKKVEIEVSSPYMRTPVKMGFVFSMHSKLQG